MYAIKCLGYNSDEYCVTVLPTLEDVEKFVGEKLWSKRKELKRGSIKVSFQIFDEEFWDRLEEECEYDWEEDFQKIVGTKLPLWGQDFNNLEFIITPFKFGDIVSEWCDD